MSDGIFWFASMFRRRKKKTNLTETQRVTQFCDNLSRTGMLAFPCFHFKICKYPISPKQRKKIEGMLAGHTISFCFSTLFSSSGKINLIKSSNNFMLKKRM